MNFLKNSALENCHPPRVTVTCLFCSGQSSYLQHPYSFFLLGSLTYHSECWSERPGVDPLQWEFVFLTSCCFQYKFEIQNKGSVVETLFKGQIQVPWLPKDLYLKGVKLHTKFSADEFDRVGLRSDSPGWLWDQIYPQSWPLGQVVRTVFTKALAVWLYHESCPW